MNIHDAYEVFKTITQGVKDYCDHIDNKIENQLQDMQDQERDQIERILQEASAVGKRNEVYNVAQSYIEDMPNMNRVEIYQQAYREEVLGIDIN